MVKFGVSLLHNDLKKKIISLCDTVSLSHSRKYSFKSVFYVIRKPNEYKPLACYISFSEYLLSLHGYLAFHHMCVTEYLIKNKDL